MPATNFTPTTHRLPGPLVWNPDTSAAVAAAAIETNVSFVGRFSAPVYARFPYTNHAGSDFSSTAQSETNVHFVPRYQEPRHKILPSLTRNQDTVAPGAFVAETNVHFTGRFAASVHARFPYTNYAGSDFSSTPQPETNVHHTGRHQPTQHRLLASLRQNSDSAAPGAFVPETNVSFIGRFAPTQFTILRSLRQNPANDIPPQPETNVHFTGRFTASRYPTPPALWQNPAVDVPPPPIPDTPVHYVPRYRPIEHRILLSLRSNQDTVGPGAFTPEANVPFIGRHTPTRFPVLRALWQNPALDLPTAPPVSGQVSRVSPITPTQSIIQAALRAFVLAALPAYGSDGNPISVIAAVQNRVPEPQGTDFVVMSAARFDRLWTNVDTYSDTKFTAAIMPASASFTASIAPAAVPGPSVMTASAVTGTIVAGAAIAGAGIATGTSVLAQLSGSPGGAGTYSVTPAQAAAPATSATAAYGVLMVSSVALGTVEVGAVLSAGGVAAGTTITAGGTGTGGAGTYYVSPAQTAQQTTFSGGQKTITMSAEATVQLDFHSAGTQASDYAETVSMLLRDEFGVDFFAGLAAPLNGVFPLYADDPVNAPFWNENSQMEWRWVLQCCLQVYQTIVVPQSFTDAVALGLVDVEAKYPN